MTIDDTHVFRARSRVDMSGIAALTVILAIVGTAVLDACAFSSFVGS